MAACEDCARYRESDTYRMFDLRCPYCAGRAIYLIGRLPRDRKELSDRRKAVLRDWVDFGHSEKQIRELATWAAVEPERGRHGKAN